MSPTSTRGTECSTRKLPGHTIRTQPKSNRIWNEGLLYKLLTMYTYKDFIYLFFHSPSACIYKRCSYYTNINNLRASSDAWQYKCCPSHSNEERAANLKTSVKICKEGRREGVIPVTKRVFRFECVVHSSADLISSHRNASLASCSALRACLVHFFGSALPRTFLLLANCLTTRWKRSKGISLLVEYCSFLISPRTKAVSFARRQKVIFPFVVASRSYCTRDEKWSLLSYCLWDKSPRFLLRSSILLSLEAAT